MGLLDLLDVIDVITDDPHAAHERRQNRRIAEAQATARAAAVNAARSDRMNDLRGDASVERLRAIIAHQDRELTELSVALAVLVEILRDNHGLDQTVYRYRVEGELAALQDGESTAEATALDVAHDQQSAREPAGAIKICTNCKGEFPLAATVVTSSGILCDRCHLASTY
jgi:predicted metal-dependent hydrolase